MIIDAGHTPALVIPLATEPVGELVATLTGPHGHVTLPAHPLGPAARIDLPASLTKDWPAQSGHVVVTADGVEVARQPVTVTRRTAGRTALREAAEHAVAAAEAARHDNDAGIAQITAWLNGGMPTTILGVVPVLRVLAEHHRAAAQQRNAVLEVLTVLIPLVIDDPDILGG